MAYCSECGSEADDTAAFCPDCGAELPSTDTPPDDTTETAACEKCDSQISVDAGRCSQCGYEPGDGGILMSILIFLSIGGAALGVLLMVVTWILVLGTDYPVSSGLTVTAFFAIITLPAVGILYVVALAERKKPTGEVRSWGDMWEDIQSD